MSVSNRLLENDLEAIDQARKCIRAGQGWVATRVTTTDEYATRQTTRLISELHQCLNTLEIINNRLKDLLEGDDA